MKLLLFFMLFSVGCALPHTRPSPEEEWVKARRPKCTKEKVKTNCNIDPYKADTLSYYSGETTIHEKPLVPLEKPVEEE